MYDPKSDPSLVEAFDQMWGRFPDPTVLVRRDRTILAQNDAARAQPWSVVGGKCYDVHPANQARGARAARPTPRSTRARPSLAMARATGSGCRDYGIPGERRARRLRARLRHPGLVSAAHRPLI